MINRVLVTGASRGIGRAIAERLVASGTEVTLVARDRARLESLADERAHVVVADLLTEEGMRAACSALADVDGFVHAAGLAEHRPLDAIDDKQIDAAFGLHVFASIKLAQAFARRDRPGSIVFIASTLGVKGAPGTLVYSASKAAQIRVAQSLAAELAPRSIRVNCVAPGAIDTGMIGGRPPEELERLRELHPLGRFGTPGEVADAVVYLLAAEWVTGTTLSVDGGLLAG